MTKDNNEVTGQLQEVLLPGERLFMLGQLLVRRADPVISLGLIIAFLLVIVTFQSNQAPPWVWLIFLIGLLFLTKRLFLSSESEASLPADCYIAVTDQRVLVLEDGYFKSFAKRAEVTRISAEGQFARLILESQAEPIRMKIVTGLPSIIGRTRHVEDSQHPDHRQQE